MSSPSSRFLPPAAWPRKQKPLIRAGGFFMVAAVGLAHAANNFRGVELRWWLPAFAAFGVAYWDKTRDANDVGPRWRALVTLGVESVAALAMIHFSGAQLDASLLAVVAGQLPFYVPRAAGFGWAIGQSVALGAILALRTPHQAAAAALGHLVFQAFALVMASLALSEEQARRELLHVNAALLATQSLLAESSRSGERLRISRELHDGLGHSLTALLLQLEVALRLCQGEARERVLAAQATAREALRDARAAVGALRDQGLVDLGPALTRLAETTLQPRIHLRLPAAPFVHQPARAHALFRCVQEIVTNAVRHSAAQNLWVELALGEAGIELRARDDGRGAAGLSPGDGLTGMRERLGELGGTLAVETCLSGGFSLAAFVPDDAPAPPRGRS